jgi:hypothetical protein
VGEGSKQDDELRAGPRFSRVTSDALLDGRKLRVMSPKAVSTLHYDSEARVHEFHTITIKLHRLDEIWM